MIRVPLVDPMRAAAGFREFSRTSQPTNKTPQQPADDPDAAGEQHHNHDARVQQKKSVIHAPKVSPMIAGSPNSEQSQFKLEARGGERFSPPLA